VPQCPIAGDANAPDYSLCTPAFHRTDWSAIKTEEMSPMLSVLNSFCSLLLFTCVLIVGVCGTR